MRSAKKSREDPSESAPVDKIRKIIHIDMDAFYASIEQLDNPELKGEPVIVGGRPDSRGVVAACSYEARAFGIHSAMPSSKAYQLCPHAFFIRPRMERYREMSQIIMTIFKSYTDVIEPLSLDEAFLDITDTKKKYNSATLLAQEICSSIYEKTGLTASAGVSSNKFVAKIASDLNKPNGISVIPPSEIPLFLEQLPIGKFFGVGKVTEKKMHRYGIYTGADLKKRSCEDLTRLFGKNGRFYFEIVRGIDSRPVRTHRTRKSIGTEKTLGSDTAKIDELESLLSNAAARVAASLMKKDVRCKTVTLKLRYNDFTTITRSKSLPQPIYEVDDLFQISSKLLATTQAGKRKVRLIGLSVSNLLSNDSKGPIQLSLPFPDQPLSSYLNDR